MIFTLKELSDSKDKTVSDMAKRLIELNINESTLFEIYLKQSIDASTGAIQIQKRL